MRRLKSINLGILIISPILILSFSSTVNAQSYYEILKTMYRGAGQKIQATDFDVVGDPSAKTCLEIEAKEPDQELLVHIRKFTYIKDGRGPALPEKRYTRIIFAPTWEPDMRNMLEKVETTFLDKEVRSRHLAPYNFELRIRRTQEGYLAFERTLLNKTVNYGYCY